MSAPVVHQVPGLPDVYAVTEEPGESVERVFVPRLRDLPFMRAGTMAGLAQFGTLDEAIEALHEFVSRMQA